MDPNFCFNLKDISSVEIYQIDDDEDEKYYCISFNHDKDVIMDTIPKLTPVPLNDDVSVVQVVDTNNDLRTLSIRIKLI